MSKYDDLSDDERRIMRIVDRFDEQGQGVVARGDDADTCRRLVQKGLLQEGGGSIAQWGARFSRKR